MLVERPQPQQRGRTWDVGLVGDLADRLGGIGDDRPAADVQHRLAGPVDHLGRILRLLLVQRVRHRHLSPLDDVLARRVIHLFITNHRADVLGQVHQHRSGPPAGGDGERLIHYPRQLPNVLHQVVPLGTRPGDAGDIGLLEGVVADHLGGHLPAEDDDRHAVHLGRGQRRHAIGRRRAAGHDAHARPAGHASVPVGTVPRPLLVAVQDELGRRLVELVEDRQDRPAGVAEHHLHFVAVDQHFVEDLRAALALIAGLGRGGLRSDLWDGLERGHK